MTTLKERMVTYALIVVTSIYLFAGILNYIVKDYNGFKNDYIIALSLIIVILVYRSLDVAKWMYK